MNTRKPIAWIGTGALLLAGFLGASFTMTAAENSDSEQVSKLLSEARNMAFRLKDDAETMQSFSQTKATWESHADAIKQVKEHINALARQLDKLKAARNIASPWQKTAIDRIDPNMDVMAMYTEGVIEYLSKHPELIGTPEYKDYIDANADFAGELAAMLGDFVEYGRAKERLQQLTDKLEVPTT
jgi:hypothetical protein